jgi:hypothetical protein
MRGSQDAPGVARTLRGDLRGARKRPFEDGRQKRIDFFLTSELTRCYCFSE